MKNYYEILGVPSSATDSEIRTAYIDKVKKYHPDTFDGDKNFAEKQTSLITEAYTTLKDYTLRKRYDLKNNITAKTSSSAQNKNNSKKTQEKSTTKTTVKENNSPKKEKTKKDKKQTEKQETNQEQSQPVKKKKRNYTKKQLVIDIAIGLLSALLIFILVLAFA